MATINKATMLELGHELIRNKVLDQELLDRALSLKYDDENHLHRNLAQILVEDLNIDHDLVYNEVARIYGFREIELGNEIQSEERIEFIRRLLEPLSESTRQILEREKILALKYDEYVPYKIIFVAANPMSDYIPTIARVLNVKRYEICYVTAGSFQALFEKVFPPQNEYLKMMEDASLEIDSDEVEESVVKEDELDAEINQSLLIHLVEGMLIEAVRLGASDIHVIPQDLQRTDVLFRVDGKLQHWHTQTGVRPESIAAVVKDRSKNIDRFERDEAQDGFIQRKIDGYMIRFRVSILPIVGRQFQYKFESIVIRILDDRKVITDFEKLGFHGGARQSFLKAISKPQGMVIVTGPTGSGKSTTLIAALSHIINPEINVLTVEDPVEYIIPGVRQLKISQKNSFDKALRAILRHDPDVVMLGEIRDRETAETAIKLANTGHLTFSTLHTNDAPSAVSRLFKIGVEPFLIAYAINIIIAQRLIRRLCESCKEIDKQLDLTVPANLGFTEEEIANTVFYKAIGCEQCKRGYRGRVAIHEALYFSKGVRSLIFETGHNIDEEAIRQLAIREGMLTLRDAAKERIKEGISTLEELAQATTEDD